MGGGGLWVWVTVGVGNFGFGVVVAGFGVVPKPRNKLLVSQIFCLASPRFFAAPHYNIWFACTRLRAVVFAP